MSDLGPIDPKKMRQMEALGREIAHYLGVAIEQSLGDRKAAGFALLLFSFEGPEFTWISNAQRTEMIRTLQELITNLQTQAPTTSEERN